MSSRTSSQECLERGFMSLFAKLANLCGLRTSEVPEVGTVAGLTSMPLRLEGNGAFAVSVVGESRYQSALEAVCGPRTRDGVDRLVEVGLSKEDNNVYDPQAVRT